MKEHLHNPVMTLLARIRQRKESILLAHRGVCGVCVREYTCMYVMLHVGVVVCASVEFCLANEFFLMDKSMKYCTANASIHP